MKLNLVVTNEGFRCATDDDYEKKRTLKRGTVVECTIKEYRNYQFHKLYFSLINLSWEYLSEEQREFFKDNVEMFRKTVEISAGHCDMVYSIARQSWLEIPKSIAFDKLSESDFENLYNKVKDVIFLTFIPEVNKEQFEYILKDF